MATEKLVRSTKMLSGSFGTTVIFLAIAIALHIDNIIFGKYSYILNKDWLAFDTPIKLSFVRNMASSGALTYWFPNLLGGIDGTSAGQWFDFMFLPYMVLPHWAASFFDVTLISFVAMISMNALLRDLDVDPIPAFLGALMFGTFSLVAPYIGLGLAGMPLIALVVRKTVTRPLSLRSFLLWIVVGSVISFASNFMLTLPFVLPLVAVWMLALDPKRAVRIMIAFFVIGLSCIAVRLPLLISVVETGPMSHRQEFDFLALYDGPVWAYVRNLYWYTLDVRWFAWVPILAILLFPRNRLLMTTVAVLLAVVLLSPAWNSLRAISQALGQLNAVNFRFQYSTAFFLAISVAVLLDAIGKRNMVSILAAGGERWKAWPLAPISGFLAALIIVAYVAGAGANDVEGWFYSGSANAYLGQPTIAELPKPDKDPYRVVTVQVKGGPEMANYPAAYGLETADGYHNNYSIRYKRFWRAVIEPSLVMGSDQQIWFDNWGHTAVLEIPEAVAANPPVDFPKYFRTNLLSLANARLVLSPVELTGFPLQHKAQENLRPRADLPARIVRRLNFAMNGSDINVYRNPDALPRFRLVGNTRVYPSSYALLADLAKASMNTLVSTVLLDAADAVDVKDVTPGLGEVTLVDYRADTFSLRTRTSSRQILVVASNYYPAWQCRVDGKPSRVFPAYETFFGTVVDEGSHDVTCTYMPWMKRLSTR
jgi:hypothetical protein